MSPDHPKAFIDLTGRQFDMLYVLRRDMKRRTHVHVRWICQCDCGSGLISRCGGQLRSGNAKSCGCVRWKNGEKLLSLSALRELADEAPSMDAGTRALKQIGELQRALTQAIDRARSIK
jgi:hypothetical protein